MATCGEQRRSLTDPATGLELPAEPFKVATFLELWPMSQTTFYKWKRLGKIRVLRTGRHVRITPAEFVRLREAMSEQADDGERKPATRRSNRRR